MNCSANKKSLPFEKTFNLKFLNYINAALAGHVHNSKYFELFLQKALNARHSILYA